MTRKRCLKKAELEPVEIAARFSVQEGDVVFREARRVPVWETWCGARVSISSSVEEGEHLRFSECEECRKAKAAAGGDVEEPPKA